LSGTAKQEGLFGILILGIVICLNFDFCRLGFHEFHDENNYRYINKLVAKLANIG